MVTVEINSISLQLRTESFFLYICVSFLGMVDHPNSCLALVGRFLSNSTKVVGATSSGRFLTLTTFTVDAASGR